LILSVVFIADIKRQAEYRPTNALNVLVREINPPLGMKHSGSSMFDLDTPRVRHIKKKNENQTFANELMGLILSKRQDFF